MIILYSRSRDRGHTHSSSSSASNDKTSATPTAPPTAKSKSVSHKIRRDDDVIMKFLPHYRTVLKLKEKTTKEKVGT